MTHPLPRPVEDDLPNTPAPNQDSASQGEPSWFFHGDDLDGKKELAERYRRLRPDLAAPPQHGGALSHGYRNLIAAKHMDDEMMEWAHPEANSRSPAAKRAKPRSRRDGEGISLAKTYMFAALAAAITGGGVGYGASQFDRIMAATGDLFSGPAAHQAKLAIANAPPTPISTAPSTTTVVKKPVTTAKLDVADVSGGLNTYIPLALHAEPGIPSQDLVLKLKGLPDSAYLTAGAKDAANEWRLTLADLENLRLVVPRTTATSFDVAVAAFEAGSGELAAPIKEMNVAIDNLPPIIEPASAQPATVILKPSAAKAGVASTIPLPVAVSPLSLPENVEAATLLAKGDVLFKSGDLQSARQFYEQAYAKGSPAGAYGAGRTYDPAVFAQLKVQGLKPDGKLALDWYKRAEAAGSLGAGAEVQRLMVSEQR